LAAHRFDIRVATDLDLVGCDCSLWRIGSLPTMTAVDISWNNVGCLALQKLLSMCKSGEATFDTILLKPRVVPGDSCPLPDNWTEPVAAKST
jgi:DNA-binding LacI/PurR family transcriptional regulator